jgi:hypothetical protein
LFKFIPAAKGAASIGRQKAPPFNKALCVEKGEIFEQNFYIS